MASRVDLGSLAIAVLGAVVIGVALGMGTGLAARSLGWPTSFVGPLTGGVVGGLVVILYQLNAKRGGGGMA